MDPAAEPIAIESIAGDGQGPRVGREGGHPDQGRPDLDATDQPAIAAVPDATRRALVADLA